MGNDQKKKPAGAGKGAAPKDGETARFESEVQQSLSETERAARAVARVAEDSIEARSWHRAREVVADFRPVPWFIWRLANFALGKPGEIRPIGEGLVLGLRKFLFALAKDSVLGAGEEIKDVRKVLEKVAPDVIAAGAVIHAVCRRLVGRESERIWRPIIDDAVLRANIGFMVGERCPDFGAGRGMLAGFAGRSGLAVLIASGTPDQAREALELLATGREVSEVGLKIYSCNPLQVSAMLLSATGAGKDAAFGSVSYALENRASAALSNEEQGRWLAAFTIAENLRMNRVEEIASERWEALGFADQRDRTDLIDRVKPLLRRGHRWGWIE